MRHSDSSPPIPPRFVAFARRYHPSTCGSLRRTPGATSTASGLVSRCPRPGGLYDGDDEASRVPGKPTRTHATRSDPGEVAASTASETRRDDLPSNARRRPSHSVHFGAQSRGLRAPCERFAPWVTPQAHASLGSGWRPTLAGWDWIPTGFRTRFRRSHHGILSPLTGLSRHTRCCTNRHGPARCQPTGSSPADAIRHGSAEGGHPIEDLTAEDDLTPLPNWAPGAKALSDDGRVSEVLKGIRVFLVPGVPGHRVRPRWRDDVHAAIERAVAFLLCVHCERRLAFDNCFAYHGRRSSWVDSSGSGPGVRPKGRGWPRHILGETRAEPIRLCRKRSFTTYRNPHGVGWLAPPARYHSCTTSSEEPPRSTVSGTSREWRFDWARFV